MCFGLGVAITMEGKLLNGRKHSFFLIFITETVCRAVVSILHCSVDLMQAGLFLSLYILRDMFWGCVWGWCLNCHHIHNYTPTSVGCI